MSENKKKGVALIWAIVLSSTLIIISTTMVDFIIKDLKMSSRMDSSSIAFAAAKSGMEVAKNYYKKLDTSESFFETTLTLEPDKVFAEISGEKVEGKWVLSSLGRVGDVARRLEYTVVVYQKTIVKTTQVTAPLGTLQPTGSYNQEFAFWFPSLVANSFTFGLGNNATATNNGLWMQGGTNNPALCSGQPFVRLQARGNSQPIENSPNTICIDQTRFNINNYKGNDSSTREQGNKFYVTISYINNTVAQLTLESWEPARVCVGATTLDLSSSRYKNLPSKLTNFTYTVGSGLVPTIDQDPRGLRDNMVYYKYNILTYLGMDRITIVK